MLFQTTYASQFQKYIYQAYPCSNKGMLACYCANYTGEPQAFQVSDTDSENAASSCFFGVVLCKYTPKYQVRVHSFQELDSTRWQVICVLILLRMHFLCLLTVCTYRRTMSWNKWISFNSTVFDNAHICYTHNHTQAAAEVFHCLYVGGLISRQLHTLRVQPLLCTAAVCISCTMLTRDVTDLYA